MTKIAVIGSGLAAISAIERLVKKGIKPIVLDCGETLPERLQQMVQNMQELLPQDWDPQQIDTIGFNNSIQHRSALPKKFSYGSDFFYGQDHLIFNNYAAPQNPSPPFSRAKGGFGNGWGGAVLPVDDCDLDTWPISKIHLEEHYKNVLSNIPFSAREDELSTHFPLYKEAGPNLMLSKGNIQFLQDFNKKQEKLKKYQVIAGQSRLLTQAPNESAGCKYCGYCMSGCVYDYIYKPNSRLEEFIKNDLIEYRHGVIVDRLQEEQNHVVVYFTNEHNQHEQQKFQRVFLGAGAINSTHIVLKSKKLFNKRVPVLSTAGFIVPIFSIKKNHFQWPDINTQPGIFMEYKVPQLSNHWIHTQLSTPNELVLQKLGILNEKYSFRKLLNKKLIQHLYVAQCNMHSKHGVGHHVWLENNDRLSFEYNDITHTRMAVRKASFQFFNILKSFGYFALLPFVQSGIGSPGFHLGGSMPMRSDPKEETETNLLGCPKGWSKIHVIDSSNFPSIPGTTIGLTAMANASRIAQEAIESSK